MIPTAKMLKYEKGKFTENNEIITTLTFSKVFFNLYNKQWPLYLGEYMKMNTALKFEIWKGTFFGRLFAEKIIIKFKSDLEMLENKNVVIDVVKKAIEFTNEKLVEDFKVKVKEKNESIVKKENLKKINEHFDNNSTDINQLISNYKVTKDSIIDVMSADGKTRFFVSLNQLKEYMVNNPTCKLEKAYQNLARVEKIKQELKVNSLDPFWYDEFGKLQRNTYYLNNNNERATIDLNLQNNTEINELKYSIQYDSTVNKYIVFDPSGEQLAVSFVTSEIAENFVSSLEYKDGRSIKRNAK